MILTRIRKELIDCGHLGMKVYYIPELLILSTFTWVGLTQFDKGVLPSKYAISVRTSKESAISVISSYAEQINKDKLIYFMD